MLSTVWLQHAGSEKRLDIMLFVAKPKSPNFGGWMFVSERFYMTTEQKGHHLGSALHLRIENNQVLPPNAILVLVVQVFQTA